MRRVEKLMKGWSFTGKDGVRAAVDLPHTWNGKDSQDQEVTYTYSVEEVLVDGYTVTYSVNNVTGVAGGTVVITNTKEEESGYTLPQTGGPGRTIYTLAGFVLVCGAAFLMYIQQKRRREADAL